MSTRPRLRSDAGAVLVFVLLLMLAFVALAHGLLVSGLAELTASSAGVRHLAARAAADAAVARALRLPGGAWMDSIHIGERRPWGTIALGRASGSTTLTRLTRESWLVEGRGVGPAGGETRTASLAWALDALERVADLPAALNGRAGAPWQIDGQIDTADPAGVHPPADPADCAPWVLDLQGRYAMSPLATLGRATDTAGGPALGLIDFPSLLAAAGLTLTGIGTPAPVERLGACVASEPWAWGDPDHPGRPCGSHLPLRSASGDLTVDGGVGQGVLVVDGDLTLRAGARYHGLVVISGALRMEGAANLDGMAIALDGADIAAGSRLQASACWAVRALAAQQPLLGRLRRVPGVGPLGPL